MLTNDADATLADAGPAPAPPPGTSADPAGARADAPSRSGVALNAITRAAGLVCAAIGVTVLVAWVVRATVILRFGSHNAMSANTALAVEVTGVALVAVTARHPRAAQVAGVFDLALGGLALTEYARAAISASISWSCIRTSPSRTPCPEGWRSALRCA